MNKLYEIMGKTLYPDHSIDESVSFIEEDLKSGKRIYSALQIEQVALEFGKLHIKAQREAIFEMVKQEGLVTDAGIAYLKNAYPDENIK